MRSRTRAALAGSGRTHSMPTLTAPSITVATASRPEGARALRGHNTPTSYGEGGTPRYGTSAPASAAEDRAAAARDFREAIAIMEALLQQGDIQGTDVASLEGMRKKLAELVAPS